MKFRLGNDTLKVHQLVFFNINARPNGYRRFSPHLSIIPNKGSCKAKDVGSKSSRSKFRFDHQIVEAQEYQQEREKRKEMDELKTAKNAEKRKKRKQKAAK